MDKNVQKLDLNELRKAREALDRESGIVSAPEKKTANKPAVESVTASSNPRNLDELSSFGDDASSTNDFSAYDNFALFEVNKAQRKATAPSYQAPASASVQPASEEKIKVDNLGDLLNNVNSIDDLLKYDLDAIQIPDEPTPIEEPATKQQVSEQSEPVQEEKKSEGQMFLDELAKFLGEDFDFGEEEKEETTTALESEPVQEVAQEVQETKEFEDVQEFADSVQSFAEAEKSSVQAEQDYLQSNYQPEQFWKETSNNQPHKEQTEEERISYYEEVFKSSLEEIEKEEPKKEESEVKKEYGFSKSGELPMMSFENSNYYGEPSVFSTSKAVVNEVKEPEHEEEMGYGMGDDSYDSSYERTKVERKIEKVEPVQIATHSIATSEIQTNKNINKPLESTLRQAEALAKKADSFKERVNASNNKFAESEEYIKQTRSYFDENFDKSSSARLGEGSALPSNNSDKKTALEDANAVPKKINVPNAGLKTNPAVKLDAKLDVDDEDDDDFEDYDDSSDEESVKKTADSSSTNADTDVNSDKPFEKIDDFHFIDIIKSKSFMDSDKQTCIYGIDEGKNVICQNFKDFNNTAIFCESDDEIFSLFSSIIVSLTLKNANYDMKFVICDSDNGSKFDVYNDLSYMFFNKIAKSTDEIIDSLYELTREIDKRYENLAKVKTDNIEAFNDIMQNADIPPMPYVVVFFNNYYRAVHLDESDMINSYLNYILRFGRLVGIYVNVVLVNEDIDDKINYNLQTRISFKTESEGSSLARICKSGAEKIMHHGEYVCKTLYSDEVTHLKVPSITQREVSILIKNIEK